ncbi:MAG: peptidoglycan binding domain-containing protein [Bacillota bacterium]|nr:peptidoglycan binding domain-containing protein [Bacillota bacterium]
MKIVRKKNFLISLILLQIILAVTAGMMVLSAAKGGKASPNTYVNSVNIGNLDNSAAIQKIENYYSGILKNGVINIIYEGGQYKLKYTDIDTVIDYNATMNLMRGTKPGDSFISLVNGYFFSRDKKISPVVKINETKLRRKLDQLSEKIKQDPVNANIYLKDGKVVKSPDIRGRKLNIDNAVERIKQDVNMNLEAPVVFAAGDSFVLSGIMPEITLKDLDGINDVLSSYSTDINNTDNEDSIKLAAYAINKVLVCPADPAAQKEAGVFSFNKYLKLENGIQEKNNDGYNQVVSTLYAALTTSGITPDAIKRTENSNHTDFISQAYNSIVLGSKTDFRFTNTLKNAVIIFAEVKDNKLTINIVGKKK